MTIGILALVVLTWSVHTWALHRLASAPGAIRLLAFDDSTRAPSTDAPDAALAGDVVAPGASAGNAAVVGHLAIHLRDRLSELRLVLPSVIPGAMTTTDFVELLGTTNVDLKQPFSTVGKALRLVRPTHAYELKATIIKRDKQLPRGVAVELRMLPRGPVTLRTYWDDSWEQALDRAARGIGAQVVPHTRYADTGPWCSWRGKPVNEDLFHAYQLAQLRTRQRRYDEALAEYYNALRLDPVNEHLRYELGHLQERRALYLDAWETYYSIITLLAERSDDGRDKAVTCAREKIGLLTRYRFTVLLGYGDALARQWLAPSRGAPRTRRTTELEDLRDRLRLILCQRYVDVDGSIASASADDLALLGLRGDTPAARTKAFAALLADKIEGEKQPAAHDLAQGVQPTPDETKTAIKLWRTENRRARTVRRAELRLLFQLLAAHEVKSMLDDYGDKDLKRLLATGLTLTALDLLPPEADLRIQHARVLLRRARRERECDDAWPTSAEQIRSQWARQPARNGRPLHDRLDKSEVFADHYNAACTYTIGLAHERGHQKSLRSVSRESGERARDALASQETRRELARCAVAELRRALNVADRATSAEQWEWIASEDPDLSGLRAEPEFRRLESERLPSSKRTPRRPTDVADLQASQHSVALIKVGARTLEGLWHTRADLKGSTNIHEAMKWWQEERNAWDLARTLALHHRHWQSREEVVTSLCALAERHGVVTKRLPQPSYTEEMLGLDETTPETYDLVEKAAGRMINEANVRFAALVKVLGEPDSSPFCGYEDWSLLFEELDHRGTELDEVTRRQLAVLRAYTWAQVRRFVHPEIEEEVATTNLVTAISACALPEDLM